VNGEKSYFAPAEKSDADTLRAELEAISSHPLVTALLGAVSGLLAVLNDKRQVLTVNPSLLAKLGLHSALDAFGLRPGEALHCVHADENPSGCGTAKACMSCGAAIAIMSSLETDGSQQRSCILKAGGNRGDFYFNIKVTPLWIDERRFLLFFIEDITEIQNKSFLERAFFHDLNNMLAGISGTVEIMRYQKRATPETRLDSLMGMLGRLGEEVEIQRALLAGNASSYRPAKEWIDVGALFSALRQLYLDHPAAYGKSLVIEEGSPGTRILSNEPLLCRILGNLLTNAFEASDAGESVMLRVGPEAGGLVISVWNPQSIPEEYQPRIFQKFYSSKGQSGRGIGGYAAKLLAEDVLGGKLDFVSDACSGTTFRLFLSIEP
jgi:signal transduction histidine kinase